MGGRTAFATLWGKGLGVGDSSSGFSVAHPAAPGTLSANQTTVNANPLPNRIRETEHVNSLVADNPRRIGWCNSDDLINVGSLPCSMR